MFQRLWREACPDIRNTHRELPQNTKAKDVARFTPGIKSAYPGLLSQKSPVVALRFITL
jgi:hypothetical protein